MFRSSRAVQLFSSARVGGRNKKFTKISNNKTCRDIFFFHEIPDHQIFIILAVLCQSVLYVAGSISAIQRFGNTDPKKKRSDNDTASNLTGLGIEPRPLEPIAMCLPNTPTCRHLNMIAPISSKPTPGSLLLSPTTISAI